MRGRLVWLGLLLFPAVTLAAAGFTLTSLTLGDGARMPQANVYVACGGGNASPALAWHDAPAGTRGYAVTMFDPDAAGGFWHWIAIDIPASARGLDSGAGAPGSILAPPGTLQLRNDFGNAGYSGPCPPPGAPHHYVITVYALDVPQLDSAASAGRDAVLKAIRHHALAHASLTATWGR